MGLHRESLVCQQCVSDRHLWALLEHSAVRGTCESCGHQQPCTSVEQLAEEIDPVYRENVQIGETHRVFGPDGDDWWEQQGESPSFIIHDIHDK